MCIPEVSRIAHTHNSEDDTDYSQNRESDQEPEPPFSVLGLIDWVASKNRETPDHSQDEV